MEEGRRGECQGGKGGRREYTEERGEGRAVGIVGSFCSEGLGGRKWKGIGGMIRSCNTCFQPWIPFTYNHFRVPSTFTAFTHVLSIGTVESNTPCTIRSHMRLHHSNTVIA